MRAYEFPAKITAEGRLELPEQLAHLLTNTPLARVILLIPETPDAEEASAEDADWHRLAAEQLLRQYDEADEIYDRI
jgi:hypothetical protein